VQIQENKLSFFVWLSSVVKVRIKVKVRFQIRLYDFVAVPAIDHSVKMPSQQDELRKTLACWP
jgi:hypothetical protein